MITLISKYSVAKENVATVVRLNEEFIARMTANEPNFICNLFPNADKTEWTCIEVAADAGALGHHLEEHGRNPEWMQAFQGVTNLNLFEIYGELPAPMAEALKDYGPQYAPLLSVADRTVVATELVAA